MSSCGHEDFAARCFDVRDGERLYLCVACYVRVTKEHDDAIRSISTRLSAAESALATERAAREEAESLAVWAVRHQTEFYVDDNIWSFRDSTRKRQYRQFGDETDAGILAALRRAMKGEG